MPYDEDAQQVLARAFDVAIAAEAEMVDVPHVVTALGDDFAA
ncbi:hypothetical protein [Aeromicrobium massiliense]|nr:hypothetical protein [Aeromicrobium massiliense]